VRRRRKACRTALYTINTNRRRRSPRAPKTATVGFVAPATASITTKRARVRASRVHRAGEVCREEPRSGRAHGTQRNSVTAYVLSTNP